MNINEVHWNISENGTKETADIETSVTFEPLGNAVFTVVLRRMSSIILYSLYLHWGLFNLCPLVM